MATGCAAVPYHFTHKEERQFFKIGIDVGGTFTDFVVVKDNDSPRYFKVESTPGDPSQGIWRVWKTRLRLTVYA